MLGCAWVCLGAVLGRAWAPKSQTPQVRSGNTALGWKPHGPLLHTHPCPQHLTPTPLLLSHPRCAAPAAAQRRPAPTHALPPTPLCRFVCIEWGCRRQRRSLLSTGAGWWPTPAAVASRHRTSQPTPASLSHGSVAVFSALLPFYASPSSAASRRWRIALEPGFVRPLGCIASLPHARSTGPRGYSLSQTHSRKRGASRVVPKPYTAARIRYYIRL